MRVLAFAHSGAGSLSWVADADYNFVALFSNSVTATSFLSGDPEFTSTAGLPTVSLDRVFALRGATANSMPIVSVPILMGKTLTHTAGAASTVLVYLEPMASAE